MKNKKQKIAVFGGSFDPPHFGHVDIVANLEKAFDKVIVMPSYASPFKANGGDEAALRYKLCKKVFESNKTEVSRYEIGKKGVSYSVDTAAYLAKKYDAELYWVIGSEELLRLPEWHDIDKLKTLVTFYVVPRPGYDGSKTLDALKKRKIKIKLARFDGLDISSTLAKIDIAFGKPNRYMPSEVVAFAKKYGIFDPYGKYVRALYRYGLTDKRIEHTYGTAVRGMELAKLYGGSVNDAVTACILHDIAKSVEPKTYKHAVDYSHFPKETVHAPIGAYIAKQEFGISDEIEHAIYVHTTADSDMSLLDEIVYLADKSERGRKYKTLDYVRFLCEADRTLAMRYALNEINSLEGTEDNEYSARAIRYYKKLCGDKKYPEMPERKPVEEPAPPEKKADGKKTEKAEKAEKTEKKEKPSGKKPAKAAPSGDKALDKVREIAYAVAAELSLHKAHNIDIVDINGKNVIADYFVIASASSTTAVKALNGYVEDRLTKQFGLDPLKRDVNTEWIALDYGSVIIHIFTDKTREFYNIERLWSDGGNVTRYED